MDDIAKSRRMNILINLSSRLLSEALQGLMARDTATYYAVDAHNLDEIEGFTPDKILVDSATLDQAIPAKWGDAKVILIDTGIAKEDVIRLLITHKLDGVISTSTDTSLFRKALQAVRDGQVWIDNSKLKAVLHNPPLSVPSTTQESFTKKEREIVLLIADGYKNREIAAQLNISEQTVKTHLSRIFMKAGVNSRAKLVPLALIFKS
jgi:DNA-binding NarL/FixJ family response regulator